MLTFTTESSGSTVNIWWDRREVGCTHAHICLHEVVCAQVLSARKCVRDTLHTSKLHDGHIELIHWSRQRWFTTALVQWTEICIQNIARHITAQIFCMCNYYKLLRAMTTFWYESEPNFIQIIQLLALMLLWIWAVLHIQSIRNLFLFELKTLTEKKILRTTWRSELWIECRHRFK